MLRIETQKVMLALCLAVCVPAPKLWAQDRTGKFITFDAPDAGTVNSPVCVPQCGTLPFAINDFGVTVGWFTDTNIVPYGFLRAPDGRITSFSAPGAGLGYGLGQGTVATAINDEGVTAGQYEDSNYVFHGSVRYPDGLFVKFDAPGAGTEANQGTLGEGINPAGEVNGQYIDANNVYHGFVRDPHGTITSFDAPGAGTEANQGTYTYEKGINPNGEIDGWYADQNNVYHGFLRARDGSFTTFDAPGSGTGAGQGTTGNGINPVGAIAGDDTDASNVTHGYLRTPDGTITIFDPTGSIATLPVSINPAGTIAGTYIDASFVLHGFQRDPDGTITTFEVPSAGTGFGQGTRPEFISAGGTIVGFYYDDNRVAHGFLRIP